MSKSANSVVVQDELQLVRDFLRDSAGYYIREKFTGIDEGMSDKEINKGIENTLSLLIDGMAKPAQFFDKDGKPLEGVAMRERQTEIEKAAEALKQDLPKYIEFMDRDILEPAKKLMTQDDPGEVLVTKMQEIAKNSVVTKTSETLEIVFNKDEAENKYRNSQSVLSKASAFFKKVKVPAISNLIGTRDTLVRNKYVERKRDKRYEASPTNALRKALKTTAGSININNTISNKAQTQKTGISR